MNRLTFITIALLAIILSGLMSIINLKEFLLIAVFNETGSYPFGGEGPTPYYYQTAELYSTVTLIWGLLFLTILLIALWAFIKAHQKTVIGLLGLTILFILGQLLQGLIGY